MVGFPFSIVAPLGARMMLKDWLRVNNRVGRILLTTLFPHGSILGQEHESREAAMTATRKQVYAALDGENENTTTSGGKRTVGEFLLFFDNYLHEAKSQFSRMAEPEASEAALNTIRKITAMGVACMEQHGAPVRETIVPGRKLTRPEPGKFPTKAHVSRGGFKEIGG
jgi:hypothetical protein